MLSSSANEDLLDMGRTASLYVHWEDDKADDESSDSNSGYPALLGRHGREYRSDDCDCDCDCDCSDDQSVDDAQDLANKFEGPGHHWSFHHASKYQISPLPPDVASFILQALQIVESSWTLDSKQEGAHENRDRTWRRWEKFVRRAGYRHHSLLDNVPADERKLLLKCFLTKHRTHDFHPSGSSAARRTRPMVSKTVRAAVGNRFGCMAGQAPCTMKENGGKPEIFDPY
jgi:hypothetical protein